jgi:hypothetical protein
MPPIRWNHPFVSNRRIVDDVEDFFEVFFRCFSYHIAWRFPAD